MISRAKATNRALHGDRAAIVLGHQSEVGRAAFELEALAEMINTRIVTKAIPKSAKSAAMKIPIVPLRPAW